MLLLLVAGLNMGGGLTVLPPRAHVYGAVTLARAATAAVLLTRQLRAAVNMPQID